MSGHRDERRTWRQRPQPKHSIAAGQHEHLPVWRCGDAVHGSAALVELGKQLAGLSVADLEDTMTLTLRRGCKRRDRAAISSQGDAHEPAIFVPQVEAL